MGRRSALAWTLACTLGLACSRAARCGTCGMKIDPASPFVAYLDTGSREIAFDTPRCAFIAWRSRFSTASAARFREYYSRRLKAAGELSFVYGSDVLGPMGPELVPVETSLAPRFARDHNGAPPKTTEDLRQGELP
jgi:hypothetical protein